MRRIQCAAGMLVGLLGVCAGEFVPFVIPLEMAEASPLLRASAALRAEDRLAAREHFYTADGRRVRLWGVNLSFAANFPTHEDAVRVAQRMAEFGVNSVRFHHMDTASWPRGLWAEDGTSLHPEALDRLDYFIDQLARRGIYTNLNLHVGRAHSRHLGLPQADEDYDKMVSLFMPPLIAAQKDFARAMLTRKNPYRGMTYAEDYAVAIVEITNENSLFMWSADRVLPTLPPVYADQLQRQFNEWLARRYAAGEQIVEAWTGGSTPLGAELLSNPDFSVFDPEQPAPAGWTLERHAGCRATLRKDDFKGRAALVVEPQQTSGTDWHLQINQARLPVRAGRSYTLQLEIAAEKPCRMVLSVVQGHAPWGNLGLWRPIEVTPDWQTLRLSFTATETSDNARLALAFGGCKEVFAVSSISLREGVAYALEPDESPEDGTLKLFAAVESPARRTDRMVFLAETEKAYFDRMYRFIKEDLGYRGMVTGTIVFGPLGWYAQGGMDFVDSHGYWQHPVFPRRPWDPGDWVIEQKAMSDHPDQATLFQMAAERRAGKPFTITEYNHPAPLDSQAECVPMIAAFAALQDWDGVWLYTYSHSGNVWDRRHLNSYFDIDSNPSKWGFMPVGARLFRDGLLPRLSQPATGLLHESVETLAGLHLKAGRNMLAAVGPAMMTSLLSGDATVSDEPYFRWEVADGNGLYAADSAFGRILTGDTRRFSSLRRAFTLEIESPAFAAAAVISLDGQPLAGACRRMLITACGRCENTGMQFSPDRSTVGRNWGTAPVRIEPVEGVIQFDADSPWNGRGAVCRVLNADGSVRKTIPVIDGRVLLSAEYGTMWYLLERESEETR